jgi:UDP-N-acetylglucosamine 4,6-dehydratase
MTQSDHIGQFVHGKVILITGGTGSFGHEILNELTQYEPGEIRVLSRDEKKQYDMQQRFRGRANLKFFLGDVRNRDRVAESMRGVDVVYHAAALKQVPNCERAPFEAVRTNIIGAENVRCCAIDAGVSTVVAVSTDKAVKPVNVMGMSKAMQERIMLSAADESTTGTRFLCVRYGNVLGSRGSVIPLFRDLISQGKPLRITHPQMTRFLLTLREAVQLVFWASVHGNPGELWVRKMPATPISRLARVLSEGITGRTDYPTEIVGIRPGEKMHEVLVSEEEMIRSQELQDHFLVPPHQINPSIDEVTLGPVREYASDGVHQLSHDELFEVLEADGWFGRCQSNGRRAA